MVPTGSAAQCSGGRPIVLYGHSTDTDQTTNIADITNTANTEGALIAAMFAAQGYIVVAPNYAGYDTSTLGYHPFLNADQQSKDMIDALTAARTALPHTLTTQTTDGGKLFITGYSQGGYVAMATHSAMQAAGMTVTASAPMSGPYALEAFGDAVFYGQVNIASTIFTPLLVTSYQKAYGNIYSALTDVYEANYAPKMADVLPSTTPIATLFSNGTLPESELFNSRTPVTGNATLDAALAVPTNPVFAAGFGTNDLVTNNFRLAYVLDAVASPDGAVPTPTAGVAAGGQSQTDDARRLQEERSAQLDPAASGADVRWGSGSHRVLQRQHAGDAAVLERVGRRARDRRRHQRAGHQHDRSVRGREGGLSDDDRRDRHGPRPERRGAGHP